MTNALEREYRPAATSQDDGMFEPTPRPLRHLLIERSSDLGLEANQPYNIKGVVNPGESSAVIASWGSGKTFLALYMAHAIATGRSIFERRVKATPVLLVELEGRSNLSRRVAAISATYGPAPDLFVYCKPFLLRNEDDIEALIAAVNSTNIGVVILDTLSRAIPGADENSAEDMTSVIGVMDRIRANTGAHFMVIHHTGKDESRFARGHSSLIGALDVAIQITKEGDGSDLRVARIVKSRDGADGHLCTFRLKVHELAVDEDGDPVTSCVIEEVETGATASKKPTRKLNDKQATVLKDLDRLLEDETRVQVRSPRDDMPRVKCVRREALRDLMQKNGRFESAPGERLTAKDRGFLRDMLTALEARGIAASTDEWVWRA